MKTTTSILFFSLLSGLAGGLAVFAVMNNLEQPEEKPLAKTEVILDSTPLSGDPQLTSSFAPVVKKVAPSVVNIYSTKTVRPSENLPPLLRDPFFRRFFGEQDITPEPRQEQGLGSGVIVTKDGYILTNNHVVEGAEEIRVAFPDGTEQQAEIVGTDPPSDLAVLKVKGEDMPAVTMADSSNVQVGDVVLAVGNPFGVGQTVTMGIVSATGRGFGLIDYEDFIQTDASINPGNSGGALADAEGRLVGINTAILSRSGGFQGIGFAVPVNLARFIMEQIIERGKVVRGYLGVYIQPLTPELAKAFDVPQNGALVGGITPDSPAAKADLQAGDVILEINGEPVADSRELRLRIAQTAPGTRVNLTVLRDGQKQNVQVRLGELPTEELVQGGDRPGRRPGPRQEQPMLDGVELGELESRLRRQLNIPRDVTGVIVTQVEPGSNAFEAGLRPGDVILEANRQPVENMQDLAAALRERNGGPLLLRVWTQGATRFVVIEPSR